MARLRLLSLSLLSFKQYPKRKLIVFINLIIFLSIFALSTAIISMIYENKIDEIDSKIINEETNILIFENQIQKTPLVLKDIEHELYGKLNRENFFELLKLSNNEEETIFSERYSEFNPFWRLIAVAEYGFEQITLSMSDAILVSNSLDDLKEIEEKSLLLNKINENLNQINKDKSIIENQWAIQEREDFEKKLDEESSGNYALSKTEYYKKFTPLNIKITSLLQSQINFLTDFNLKFFKNKKFETQQKILKMENELENLSNQEALIILCAFILQFIIFLSVQYFEITIELPNAKKPRKK